MAATISSLRIALAGLSALAVAMGIGRFAFTPILPMMLHDGVVDLRQASWLASTNYIGYLLGALLCTFDPWLRRRLRIRHPADATLVVRLGLAATAILTLAMALPWPAIWPTLRFGAGVASAYVLVYSSGWCLTQIAVRGASHLGGMMFAGPGAGIVVSGLIAGAMVSSQWRASAAWVVMALLAAMLSAATWSVFRHDKEAVIERTGPRGPGAAKTLPTLRADVANPAQHGAAEVTTLAVAYGLAGFGYIVTATFLPVIARTAVPGSPLIDLFWPIVGAGAVAGALLALRLSASVDRRWLLAGALVIQAVGIVLGVVLPTVLGFAIGSLLVGIPFAALSLFTLQEARRIRPYAAASTIGLVTVLYAIGQALGPQMVAVVLRRSGGDAPEAFQRSLLIAALALLMGATLSALSARFWPTTARRQA
ncbi:MAG: YbfB/YjiJ family MFS transporter [Pseudomonadota bacterium]|nr:YbfB/YjiJ family MFS transporter [Pseudomonadota bacterium]